MFAAGLCEQLEVDFVKYERGLSHFKLDCKLMNGSA